MIGHSHPTIDKLEFIMLKKVLASGYLSENRYVRNLEKELKDFIEARFAVATNSGTSALHILLLGLNISGSDEVIMPSYVCSSLLNAIVIFS